MTVKPKKTPGSQPTLFSEPEQFLDQTVERFRENAGQLRKDTLSFVKREPEKALLSAVALGYVLRTLPLVPILGILTRLAVGVFKPVALAYMVARAFRPSPRPTEQ